MMSRLNGVDMTSKSVSLESKRQKPSWCFDVMTMYFIPAVLGHADPLVGIEFHRVELRDESCRTPGAGSWRSPGSIRHDWFVPFHSPAGTE